MIERRAVPLLSVLVVMTMLAMSQAWGDTPSVESAEPNQGFVDEDTGVTLTGEGYEPGSGVLLTHGGPFITGSYETPDLAREVAVAGDLAYVVEGSTLMIIDITDPQAPALAGSHPLPESPSDVAVAGGYAYVANGESGLQVIDVRDPQAPTFAGSYDTPDYASQVAVAGNHAFVADNEGGLQVIDVSDPLAPALAGSYDTPGSVRAVAVAGNHAYVTDDDEGLLILEINNPQTPVFAGGFVTPERAFDVAVAGNYAYLPVGRTLLVIDVSDPEAPALAGDVARPGVARDLAVAGDSAYVVDAFGGLRVIDVSDPEAPFLTGSRHLEFPTSVAVAGDYAYATVGQNRLQVVDVSDTSYPALAGIHAGGHSSGVALAGDYAYLADQVDGLQVIDVRDPRAPVLAGSYGELARARDVAVAGDYAYVADFSVGMRVLDISDPHAPDLVATWDTSGLSVRVTLVGDYAYLANRFRGLYLLDISDPRAPVFVKRHVGQVNDVAVVGDYAYVAGDVAVGRWGLRVVDMSSQYPVRLSALATPCCAEGIVVAGNHAYIANGAGLTIVDISDPRAPVLAGHHDTQGPAWDVVLRGDLAYVAVSPAAATVSGGGLEIVDVSDPGDPALVGRYGRLGSGVAVAVEGDHAYVAAGSNGFWVVRFNPLLRDVSPVSGNTIDLTVPAGFPPGPYDVVVTNPGGEEGTLSNGFRVCERRVLDADLEPVLDVTLPRVRRRPVSWKMRLDGDEIFFDPEVRHSGMLTLPELPSNLETRFEPGDGSGRMTVELRLAPRLDSGAVVLIGDDPAALTALWEEARAAGGFGMPRLDDHNYGEVMLGVHRTPGAGSGQWSTFGESPGGVVVPAPAPIRYRYVFSDEGRLTRVRARGPGVDLMFQAVGEDNYRCETADTVSFVETLGEICDQFGSTRPELALRCPL